MLKHLSELIVAVVTMIGSLATIYLKHLMDVRAKSKEDLVRLSHENDIVVYDKLEEIRLKLDADRAYLIQYHNGSHYNSGQSMLKMSMSHEVARPGISREIHGAQNLPLSLFAESVKAFYENGKVVMPDVNAPGVEESLRQMYIGRGILSSYSVPIKDIQGRIMGALCVNYVTEAYVMPDEEFEYMVQNALVMAGYMRSLTAR